MSRTRVLFFKNEGEIDGEPYGPARVGEMEPDGRPISQPRQLGEPYKRLCECERAKGDEDSNCERCGGWIEPAWLTLTSAQEKADLLGLELRAV